MASFAEKSVLVTGAGRGIGKRIALGFAAAGARVGLLARSTSELDAAQLEIEHAGGTAITTPADVREYALVNQAVTQIDTAFGGISVLIAAAGIQGAIGPFAQSSPVDWQETLAVNTLGVMHAVRAVLPGMIERRSGKIIVITCAGAASARGNFACYAASKTAVVRLVECIAAEVDSYNVQINTLSPGGSYTATTDEILASANEAGASEVEEARQIRLTGGVTAEKQIAAALFLASDRSNHINGKMISITDDLRRLEEGSLKPDMYTLRRLKT